MSQWLLAYYADDFTGATDAMEWLERAGIGTLLTMKAPQADLLARFPEKLAVGIAGLTRASATHEISGLLAPALVALRGLRPRHIHYKVCSTFDSSPSIGSIGRAMDVAADIVPGRFLPLIVGAPQLGRFCVFGHLFARMGIGSDGGIYRLDRHPAMMVHPTTPADESDLRRHLSRQTSKRAELFDVLQFALPIGQRHAALQRLLRSAPEVLLFDALYPEHLTVIGQLLEDWAQERSPLMSFGSSAVELSLANAWMANGQAVAPESWTAGDPAERLLILSGSCSPTTSEQIEWVERHGYPTVPLDVGCRNAPGQRMPEIARVADAAASGLRNGGRAIVFTNSMSITHPSSTPRQSVPPEELGAMLADVARAVMEQIQVTRLCIAGGDTSGYVARALGIEAIAFVRPQVAGAPICQVVAGEQGVLSLEVVFKGGQVGGPNYFEVVAESDGASSGATT